MTKEDLASWLRVVLKKTLIKSNIIVGFKGTRIWPLDFEVVKEKMDSSDGFLPQTLVDVVVEEEVIAEIMEEGIPPPPSHVTHLFVDNEEDGHDIALSQEEPPVHGNISTFLKLPQGILVTRRATYEPLVNYSQFQIITSDSHVETLHKIAKRKEQLAKEKEAKILERKLTKVAGAAEKQRLMDAKEQRAIERKAKKSLP